MNTKTKIKFGHSTNPAEDLVDEITDIAKQGFDFVEVSMEWPWIPEILTKRKSNILKSLKENNIEALVAHAPVHCELGSLNDTVRNAWLEEAKMMINASSELGIKMVNFHIFFIETEKSKKTRIMKNYVESFRHILKYADKKEIRLLVENTWEDIDDIQFIVDSKIDVGLNIDVGHAFIKGKMPFIISLVQNFPDNIHHFHMHDNNGHHDEHLPIGMGKINFQRIAKELQKIKYNRSITFEIFGVPKKQAKVSMSLFKDMLSAE